MIIHGILIGLIDLIDLIRLLAAKGGCTNLAGKCSVLILKNQEFVDYVREVLRLRFD